MPDLIKPEGWEAPTHFDNVGLLGQLFEEAPVEEVVEEAPAEEAAPVAKVVKKKPLKKA